MEHPVVHAFLFADKVFREAETSKVHVAGTFNRIMGHKLPLVHPCFFVYLCLNNIVGAQHRLSMEVRYLETGREILAISQQLRPLSPLDVVELNFAFNNVTFSESGLVEFVIKYNDEFLSSRTLAIDLVAPPASSQPPKF